MSVELLDLDLLLVFVGVVEDDHLHRALELLRVLEVYREAALAEFVLWLLPGLLKLTVQFLEVSRWRSLCALLGDLVGGARRLDLEVDLLILFLLALWLQNAFVPHFILVLHLLLFGGILVLLTLEELFVILQRLRIGLLVCLRFPFTGEASEASDVGATSAGLGLLSYVLQ